MGFQMTFHVGDKLMAKFALSLQVMLLHMTFWDTVLDKFYQNLCTHNTCIEIYGASQVITHHVL